MELSKNFEPQGIEQKWNQHWMKQGYFNSKPDQRTPYTIVMPPPNVTGVLHMGHMMNNSLQDILIRRARMRGFNACWVPGTDHASIATEAKVVSSEKLIGTTTDIAKSISNQVADLNQPLTEYNGPLVQGAATLADTVKNMWTIIADLRNTVKILLEETGNKLSVGRMGDIYTFFIHSNVCTTLVANARSIDGAGGNARDLIKFRFGTFSNDGNKSNVMSFRAFISASVIRF